MTRYYTIPPPPALAPFVRFFWVFEMDIERGKDYVYRSMADGCAELVFHYKGAFKEVTDTGVETQSYSLLHAPSKQYKRFVTSESFGIFGAFLYPYAIPYLFGMPASETVNYMINLISLWGAEGRKLEEEIMLAGHGEERVFILSQFLQRKLANQEIHREPLPACIDYILKSGEPHSIKALAHHFNLSIRQLERKFNEFAGFSPKLFTRIVRFQSALKEYSSTKKLTDIAYGCGYFDQSHFIQDFKAFSGYYPSQYFKGRPEGVEWRET